MVEKLEEKIREGNYDVFGFSLTHVNLESDAKNILRVKRIAESYGKNKKPIFIAGGQEATHNYEELIRYLPLDAIIFGYGEKPLGEILGCLTKGELGSKALKDIKGLVYRDESGVVHTTSADPVSEDAFRQLAFNNDPSNLIPYEEYWQRSSGLYSPDNLKVRTATLRMVRMFTSSHCLNGCGFCSSSNFLSAASAIHAPIVRLSAQEIISLVKKNIETHHPDAVYFNDDDFIIDDVNGRQRVIDFCKYVAREKAKGSIPDGFRFYGRS